MNKILFLILSLIFVACSPQVTVTLAPSTSTPIPTPTLHPDFIALQNLISDSSQRLTLMPDGSIEDNGTVIPNLHVDQNGIINIIFNNEHVAIDSSQITFDDENGLTIEGYTLDENGEWVEAKSEAMQTFQADFEKYNASTEQFNVEEKDGNLVVTNAEGEILYQNGSFEPLFLGQLIVENEMCLQTEWTNLEVGEIDFSKLKYDFVQEYAQPLLDYYNLFLENKAIQSTGKVSKAYHLGDGCWGIAFYYSDNQDKVWFFWQDTKNKVHRQLVFLKSDQE